MFGVACSVTLCRRFVGLRPLRQSNFRLEIKRSNNKEVNIVNSVHTIAIIFFHVTLSMAAVVAASVPSRECDGWTS